MKGGYKIPYNPVPTLQQIDKGINLARCWEELWNELHHQGDIGEASYASLVKLVELQQKVVTPDWNFYTLTLTILTEQYRKTNPVVPGWLKNDFEKAIDSLYTLCLRDLEKANDPALVQSILSVLAFLKKETKLAVFIGYSDPAAIEEYLEEKLAWNELYEFKK